MHLLFSLNYHLPCFCFFYELLIIVFLFLCLLKEIERRVGQFGKAACTCQEAVGRWDTAEGGPTKQTPKHKGRPAVQNADVWAGNKCRWLKNKDWNNWPLLMFVMEN